ncbi:MAG: extracellular solute-binding protein [Verrucomicrobia bacterium]|nr:extracellular solute-binding protein [Verrucomicrobiota bacterium]MCH8513516.1 hypothetical protein [Kiritimatiellia bacterium]
MKEKSFNPNWIGLALIVGTFGYSAFRFAVISINLALEDDPDAGKRVVRVLHWQLEPGYREGLQAGIDLYNQLPHVKENDIEVRQLAVTERVYAQFINVHLISGTAPDIVVKGMSQLVGSGAATARFFEPISEHVKAPNPYHAEEKMDWVRSQLLRMGEANPNFDYQPQELDAELKEFLQTASWNETFTDGMQGGWDDQMQDYYAVPISSWGAMRTFYNQELVAEIKAFLAEIWANDPHPKWLVDLIEQDGIVTPDEAFVAWVNTPEIPDTLGRFIIFNEATLAFAAQKAERRQLVPIAASNYFPGTMLDRYVVPFTYRLGDRLDLNRDSHTNAPEILGTWQAGQWDFNEPSLRDGFFDLTLWLARYYPAGFLGLDREQATRRFLSQQAVFITTGGWDAPTLFDGASDMFTVGVTDAPLPIEGERWYEFSAGRGSEAEHRLGVPMAIYRMSRNKDIAIDFLRFITSFEVNQTVNEIAGWVPCVVGARPVESMLPFLPNTEGLKSSVRVSFGWLPTVGHVYNGQFPLFQSGAISYEEFISRLSEGFLHERSGIDRMWHNTFVGGRDRARQSDRSMVVVHLEAHQEGWNETYLQKYHNLMESSLRELDGFSAPATFHTLFEDRTFPEY